MRARVALSLACLHRFAGGSTLLETLLAEVGADSGDAQVGAHALVLLLETAVLLGNRAVAAQLLPLLAPAAGSACSWQRSHLRGTAPGSRVGAAGRAGAGAQLL